MAVISGQVTCPSNAATLVVAALNSNANATGAPGATRSALISNPSAQAIYLGGSAVSSATGFLLAAGASVTLQLSLADALYGRGASFSPVLQYLVGGS